MNELKNDKNLRQAVNRREQQLPPMPADLNERLMQRIAESEPARSETKPRRLWLYAAIAVAASIALLIVFNFGKEQTSQEPLVAKHIVEKPVVSEPEPVEEPESVAEEPQQKMAETEEQPSRKPVKKQRKVVMKRVELIPTSEAEPTEMKTMPASVIAQVKAYDQQSDLSRTTGIDDADPLVAMAAQMEDIRQRGMRLHEEIRQQMKN
jgi:hypothetical protein